MSNAKHPKDEWVIIRRQELPYHKVIRYQFKCLTEVIINNCPMHPCKEINATSEEDAWQKLEQSLHK